MNTDILSEILPNIYLTNKTVASNLNIYEDKNIKAVLNCSKDLPFYKEKINQLRISIDVIVMTNNDNPDANPEFYKQISTAVEFIHNNKPILVHYWNFKISDRFNRRILQFCYI